MNVVGVRPLFHYGMTSSVFEERAPQIFVGVVDAQTLGRPCLMSIACRQVLSCPNTDDLQCARILDLVACVNQG